MNGTAMPRIEHNVLYTESQEKSHPFYICYNLVRCRPIFTVVFSQFVDRSSPN